MKNQTIYRFATSLIALAILMAPLASRAELRSKSKEIVVVEPKDFPEQAQLTGDDLLLHADSVGRQYLYLEQQNGARLAVLDVTDPARIKPVSTVSLQTNGAFDFIRPLNDRAELIRFRRSGDVAVLNLSKAKTPTLRSVAWLADPGTAESLGTTSFLTISGSYNYVRPLPHDFQVVDISTSFDPVLLTTIKQVQHRVANDETGTTFLLGSEGLTVIRKPAVEAEYQEHERQLEQN